MARITIGITFILITLMLFSPYARAGCITHHNSHLRASSTINSKILDILPKYYPFSLIERKGDWLKIKTKYKKGWAHKKVLNENLDCMLILSTKGIRCNTGEEVVNHNFHYLESFKVLKKEIGCNYVQDRKNNRFWIKSYDIWPKDQSKTLEISRPSSRGEIIS